MLPTGRLQAMIIPVDQWTPREAPTNAALDGEWIGLRPWNADHHAEALWHEFGGDGTDHSCTAHLHHFGWGEIASPKRLAAILDDLNARDEFRTCVFVTPDGRPVGMASYIRWDIANGVAETGAVATGRSIARTPAATEAHALMMRRIFDELGYRRYEWKLNDPNAASHKAAQRMGFSFEGVFRQHQVKPYGNRDTAWYSMLDWEWPARRAAFEAWLSPQNFEADGTQREGLRDLVERFTDERPRRP